MALLSPDLFYSHVKDIDLDALRAQGIDSLLLDIDNTILPRDTGELTDELRGWVCGLLEAGFRVSLVSNNWHDHVKRIAVCLGVEMVPRALKPLPFGFLAAVRRLETSRRRTAVIGDQIFTDILGGNLIGATTILVLPLSETDLAHTLVLRKLERRILAGRAPLS